MPLEPALAPIMVPVTLTQALLCHTHRQASRYSPRIIPLDTSRCSIYGILPVKIGKGKTIGTTGKLPSLTLSAYRALSETFANEEIAFDVINLKTGQAVYQFRQRFKWSRATFDLIKLTPGKERGDEDLLPKTAETIADAPSCELLGEGGYLNICAPLPRKPNVLTEECEEKGVEAEQEKPVDKSFYKSDNPEDPPYGKHVLMATIKAGLWSTVETYHLFETSRPQFYLGINNVTHQSDFLDNYRLFTLSDSIPCQWTKRGMFMERVYNLGQHDSEVRERCGKVYMMGKRGLPQAAIDAVDVDFVNVITTNRVADSPIGTSKGGYVLQVDENKMCMEVAVMTSFISYLDHWNTTTGVGGVYYPLKASGSGDVPWRRITRGL